jgi:hypothetical protein
VEDQPGITHVSQVDHAHGMRGQAVGSCFSEGQFLTLVVLQTSGREPEEAVSSAWARQPVVAARRR